jgi:hypothetical protein
VDVLLSVIPLDIATNFLELKTVLRVGIFARITLLHHWHGQIIEGKAYDRRFVCSPCLFVDCGNRKDRFCVTRCRPGVKNLQLQPLRVDEERARAAGRCFQVAIYTLTLGALLPCSPMIIALARDQTRLYP